MRYGVVKLFLRDPKKRHGFISPDDGGADVLVGDRAMACAGIAELKAGDRVTFTSERNDKGERVTEILSVESATSSTPSRRYFDLTAEAA